MPPKLFKAAEVCDLAQLQPYVLRSWEKEFPGIGVQKGADGPRFYRQSDVDQVLRIKQLVFGEGLTLAGARRRLEEKGPAGPAAAAPVDAEVAEVLDALAADARARIARVREGLRALLGLLASAPGTGGEDFQLSAPVKAAPRRPAARRQPVKASRAVNKAGKAGRRRARAV